MHPTAEQLDRYRQHLAPPAELLAVDAHVASCDRCYAVVRADVPAVVLRGGHLTYEELESYVDRRADADDRRLVTAHVAQCSRCRGDLSDLHITKFSIMPSEHRQRFAIIPE